MIELIQMNGLILLFIGTGASVWIVLTTLAIIWVIEKLAK